MAEDILRAVSAAEAAAILARIGIEVNPNLDGEVKEERLHQPGRPVPVDVCELAEVGERTATVHVVKGLQRPQEIICLAGEEGEGKTTMQDQMSREMLLGHPVLAFFPIGEMAPERILYVDTHQERPEHERRATDMEGRGLAVPPGRMYWQGTGEPMALDSSAEDRAYLASSIASTGADYLVLDSAEDCVTKPREDIEVRAMFGHLSKLMAEAELKGIMMAGFLRKRAQGEYGRTFDDLFGSRVWKARLSKALYLEGGRLLCFKDRGRDVTPLWPGRAGRYPVASVVRPGLEDDQSIPFVITAETPEEPADVAALEERTIALVTAKPEEFTKTALAEELGGKRKAALAVVNRLVASGQIGPDKRGAKLRIPVGRLLDDV